MELRLSGEALQERLKLNTVQFSLLPQRRAKMGTAQFAHPFHQAAHLIAAQRLGSHLSTFVEGTWAEA